MKRFVLVFFSVASFSLSSFCQQKAVQKATIQTPAVLCEDCKTRIENHIAHEDGIASVRADFHKHTVTVSWYTDRTNIENIKTELANMGFDADDVTAEPDAQKRLPPCCKLPAPLKK